MQDLSGIRQVVLDWSGTLVNDLSVVWQATNTVLGKMDLPAMTLDEFRSRFCLPLERFYRQFTFPKSVRSSDAESWFYRTLKSLPQPSAPIPRSLDFLRFCQSQGLRLFLCSSISLEHFQREAPRLNLKEFFEDTELGARDKREALETLVERNRLVPEETLFVGDMRHDIEAARHVGVRSCAVLTGYDRLNSLRTVTPDLIIEHLGELQSLLSTKPDGHHEPALEFPVVTVGALVFDRIGRVLMIRTHKWSHKWGIPGGKIKCGETADSALKRELLEETGLEVDQIRLVMVQDCIDPPEFYRQAHFVLLNYTCTVAGPVDVVLNEEAEVYQWIALDGAMGLDLNVPTRLLLELVRDRADAACSEIARVSDPHPATD